MKQRIWSWNLSFTLLVLSMCFLTFDKFYFLCSIQGVVHEFHKVYPAKLSDPEGWTRLAMYAVEFLLIISIIIKLIPKL
jgi:hypothetical protein